MNKTKITGAYLGGERSLDARIFTAPAFAAGSLTVSLDIQKVRIRFGICPKVQ
jgi:hypothetical protein